MYCVCNYYFFLQIHLGAFGGDDEEETNEDGELVSVVEARREAEEKRREKHRQMEAEREDIRQNIRDKVTLFCGFYVENISNTQIFNLKMFVYVLNLLIMVIYPHS